jgi:hypothetical protein
MTALIESTLMSLDGVGPPKDLRSPTTSIAGIPLVVMATLWTSALTAA